MAICIALPGWAQGAREYRIEIDRVPLSSALRQFSLQTGLQVGRLPDVRASDKTFVGPLKGRYTAEAALTQLLASSGYSFKQVNERTIAIVAAPPPPRTGVGTEDDGPNRKPKSRPYMLARTAEDEGLSGAFRDEEVLVTGSRLERSGEGPVPIMAFDNETMEVGVFPDR